MKTLEYAFECPLTYGLHARPASRLAEVASRFTADVTLANARTAAAANAKSALAIVAIDARHGDPCRLRCAGADAAAAHAALREFILTVLPGCDEPLPEVAAEGAVALPRVLRHAGVRWYPGTPVCAGVGRGAVTFLTSSTLPTDLAHLGAGSHAQEREKVRRAIAAVCATLEARLAARPSPVAAGILGAHLSIASDVALAERILQSVARGQSAGQAILAAAAFFTSRLTAAESLYVRERAIDVEDISLQLLEQIYGEHFRTADVRLTRPAVVVAETLAPRQLLALDRRFLKALVLERAGTTSHAVVLARAFDIPMLTGVAEVRSRLAEGLEVVIDADLGVVITEVGAPVTRYYEREERRRRRRQERLARHALGPAVTRDGQRLEVAANVGTAEELVPAFAQGADAIGLFRTEMLFLDRAAAPSEDEQFAVYADAARVAGGRPVLLRTIDIGGDKPVPYLDLPREANPYLGCRGVRLYPRHRDVFVTQLRAILRASAFGRLWIMIPMVSEPDEVRWVKARLAEARAELASAGVAFDPDVPLGIMVEVPSVAFLLDQLGPDVDFLSIGTNDLTQYLFAADRDNDRVSGLHSPRHPACLRLLAKIAGEARARGCWLGLCGEMAASPFDLPLLLGLGLDEISTSAPGIPALKSAVAQHSAADCRAVLERALACRNVAEVEGVLAAFQAEVATVGLLDRDLIALGSDSESKAEAIQEIVDALYAAGRTDRPLAVEEAVWARESTYSTGLGNGFAVPHCRTDAVSANSVALVRLARPVEWGSADARPVECVILLAVREADPDDTHLKIFSKLARSLMHDEFRARLLAAPDADAVLGCLAEELGIPAERAT
jgi:fructose-specific PTS system IIA-like component